MADTNTTQLEKTVTQQVQSAVVTTIAKPEVDANMSAATKIIDAVVNGILPTLLNATNNEPWYQSKVLWGQFVVIIGILLNMLGVTLSASMAVMIPTLGIPLVGAAITIYGRLKAKKPPTP